MTKRLTRKTIRSANKRVDENLTDVFIRGVLSLPSSPKADYLKDVFLDKYVSPDTAPSSVRRQRAINKWLATERENEATNDRLLNTRPDFQILPGVTYEKFVEKCRTVIANVIGEVPEYEALIGQFSGGATTSRKRTESHPASKYLGQADITEGGLQLFSELFEDMPGWATFKERLTFNVVPGNVLFTVLKNTDIDRVACKEPDINMFLQKGLGSTIRRALRRVGQNLNDQSRNRDLARIGSLTGKLATIDLSSASDSVSSQLVFTLLPIHWFILLDAARSPVTVIDGEEHRNEMFSSMGNGFTFELESLLFWALAKTTAYFCGISGVISVYGDDIIAPSALYTDLVWILSWFGFAVNTKKSFHTGPFRESCGGHFINGRDVTPFYLRGPIVHLTDLIHACNMLRKWSVDVLFNDSDVWPLWDQLRSHVPKNLWGGHEYSSKLQLVSDNVPRSALWPKTSVKDTGDGGYVHWLNSTMNRIGYDRQLSPRTLKTLLALKTKGISMSVLGEHAAPGTEFADGDFSLSEPIVTSEVTSVVPIFRIRRVASTVTRVQDFFLEEILGAEKETV